VLADVAAGGGDLAEPVEVVQRLEIGQQLARAPKTGCPEGEDLAEQAADQIVGGVLKGRPLAPREAAELELPRVLRTR
jgi:hypothetical protein